MSAYEKEPLKKVQVLALSYYARKDIQNAMFEFCKNRETVANFNNKFFAKRPDCFDYPSDILNSARSGATSFHCSEEIWSDPLKIKTNMTSDQYNEIKTGWDLLIDIDSPFLDYGKIAAKLLIETLERNGVKNYGIKFSGSKGFHILVPFAAFPDDVSGLKTKDQFPEWPRLIAKYLFKEIKDKMNKEILKLSSREKLAEKGELSSIHLCPKCEKPTQTKTIGVYKCSDPKCKSVVDSMKSNRKEMQCPSCNGKMIRISKKEIHFCENCKINTAQIQAKSFVVGGEKRQNETKFTEELTTKSTEDSVDLVLVAPRHLFRAPYSLHEKTALASIPIKKEDLENFKPSDADPLKITKINSYMPSVIPGEAKTLLLHALEERQKEPEKTKKYDGASLDLKGLTITEEMFPPIIKTILKGIKTDGRKRALSILLSFFSSLEFPKDFMEEKIEIWNKKNHLPLKQGYIKSQVEWYAKNKRLPPNYDKPVYKALANLAPEEQKIKNPINYTIRAAMRAKGFHDFQKENEFKKPSREI